ncbi:E3 SUMO-protein ligase ZBED1-like [Maniola jurtina]|uniref:E3 SUMO-protein ligase ZBED1-like n=1 Tax=Maniola jurtina TaxID=191418 RepID=UPI001E688BAC|nr:E3 SUMO-protein ligase ZBED1-like [Maniola jurtina]
MPPNKFKSKIWNFFKKIGEKEAMCKLCNKKLKTSGNTTNLRGHLENVHSQQWEDSEIPNKKARRVNITDYIEVNAATPGTSDSNIVELSSASHNYVNTNPSTSLGSIKEINSSQNLVASTPSSIDVRVSKAVSQPNVDDFINNIKSITSQDGTKSKKITEAITNFIIMDNRPFSAVEGKGFLQLMKEVCPLYKVPSRETIKSRIDDKYDAMSNLFKTYIKNAENYCITYDIWTETMQNKSFVGLTIHFLDKSKLLSGTLGVFELTESHTSLYITEKLKEIFAEWNISIEKVSAIITDSDSTLMKVNRDMFGEKKIIPCFAHKINLVVTKSIEDAKNCNILISKVRDIVKFIKRSVNASDELRKRQIEMGLKEGQIKKMVLDVRTRWNSCFYMVQRFMELVSIVGAILLTRPEAPAMISGTEIDCVKEMIELLCPFEKLTREISGDSYVTVSKVIPLVSCIREVVENITPKNEMILEFKEEIKKQLVRRFDTIEHSAILAISTALDPRFKLMHFKNAVAKGKVISYLNKYVREYNSSPTASNDASDESDKDDAEFDIWKYHKQLTHKNMKNKSATTTETISETEVQMYLSSPVTPIKRDAIEIWDDMKSLFPKLGKIAMIYLPIVATSVPSERLFSEAGATITQDRNRLLGSRLSKLLFLNSISKLLHSIK